MTLVPCLVEVCDCAANDTGNILSSFLLTCWLCSQRRVSWRIYLANWTVSPSYLKSPNFQVTIQPKIFQRNIDDLRPRFKAAHDIYRQTGRISQLDRTRLVSGRIESGLFSVVECQWASALPYLWSTHSCCLQLNMFHFHCRNVTQIISPVIVGSEWSEIRAKRLAALFNIRFIHSRVRYDTMDSETNSEFENPRKHKRICGYWGWLNVQTFHINFSTSPQCVLLKYYDST